MIKARARLGNRDTMILGITRENIDRLLDNQPIMFSGGELGWPEFQIVIIAGETINDLEEDLRSIGVVKDGG